MTVARPLVHIGYHKTATTWFQKAFYPVVANGRYAARKQVRQALLEPKAFGFDPAAARCLLRAGEGDRLLICEENLSGYPHNGALGGLVSAMAAERIKAALPDAQIVIFLREQTSAIAACYAQYVRSGGTRSLASYLGAQDAHEGALRHWYKAPLFDPGHFDYGPALARYRDLFGASSVHIFLYEAFAAEPRTFLADFCRRLELDVDFGSLDTCRRNPSLSAQGVRLMRRLNLFTPQSVMDKTCLAPLPGWYKRRWSVARKLLGDRLESGDGVTLGPDLETFRQRYAAGNSALAAQWRLPLSQYGYAMTAEMVDATGIEPVTPTMST